MLWGCTGRLSVSRAAHAVLVTPAQAGWLRCLLCETMSSVTKRCGAERTLLNETSRRRRKVRVLNVSKTYLPQVQYRRTYSGVRRAGSGVEALANKATLYSPGAGEWPHSWHAISGDGRAMATVDDEPSSTYIWSRYCACLGHRITQLFWGFMWCAQRMPYRDQLYLPTCAFLKHR